MPVSYVVTVYNKATYLPQVLPALQAELDDTGGEIILVDDGSSDGSAALLRTFADATRHVTLHSQANAGVFAATNVGLGLASSPFIRLVDADDVLVRGSTTELLRMLQRMNAGLAYGRSHPYTPGQPLPGRGQVPLEIREISDPMRRMIKSQPFIPSAMIAGRDLLQAILPLPVTYRTSQDFLIGLRLARLTRFVELNSVVCFSPSTAPGRLSADTARMYSESACILADELEAWPEGGSRYLRYATRRTASRALRYLRRNGKRPDQGLAWLRWTRFMTYLPFMHFAPGSLRQIARAY